MTTKFGAIHLPGFDPFVSLPGLQKISKDSYLMSSRPADLLSKENAHWKEWIGTIKWENVFVRQGVFILTIGGPADGIANQENIRLSDKAQNIYRAVRHACPWRAPQERPIQISGEGVLNGSNFVITSLRTFGSLDFWNTSAFFSNDALSEKLSPFLTNPNRICDISSRFSLLENFVEGRQGQNLTVSIVAFDAALGTARFDYKIPHLVRCIEAIVALPKGMGESEFVRRAKTFTDDPALKHIGYNENELEESLRHAFLIRNACVHGMPYDEKIREIIPLPQVERELVLTRNEFICEQIARRALQTVLENNSRISLFNNRQDLEKSWADNSWSR